MCNISIGKNQAKSKTNQPMQQEKNPNNIHLQLQIKHTISFSTFLLFYDSEKQQKETDAAEMYVLHEHAESTLCPVHKQLWPRAHIHQLFPVPGVWWH